MSGNSWADQIRKVLGGLILVAGIGVGAYTILILSDILTTWWVYTWFAGMLAGRGIDGYLAKMLGATLAVVSLFATHNIGKLILKRNKRMWALQALSVLVLVYGSMYAVSYKYSGGVFDVWTGQPIAKYYKTSDGQIQVMPLDAKVGPDGQALNLFDNPTAEAYRQQEILKRQKAAAEKAAAEEQVRLAEQQAQQAKEARENAEKAARDAAAKKAEEAKQAAAVDTGFFSRIFGEKKPEPPKPFKYKIDYDGISEGEFWIEKVQVANRIMVTVTIATEGLDGKEGRYRQYKDSPYLADDHGDIWQLHATTLGYDYSVMEGFLKPERVNFKMIRAGEIFRYEMIFAVKDPVPSGLKLYNMHPKDTQYIELDGWVKNAERITTTPPTTVVVQGTPQDNTAVLSHQEAPVVVKPVAYSPPPEPISVQPAPSEPLSPAPPSTDMKDYEPPLALYKPDVFGVMPAGATSADARISVTGWVSKTGDVEYAYVVNPGPYLQLSNMALETFKKWKYSPAKRNGLPIIVRVYETLYFNPP